MNKSITKQQILELTKGQNFKTEDEFRTYIVPRLTTLFKVKESQIDQEASTTSFDYKLSNRADILIKTDDTLPKVLIVIELKLSNSVEGYKGGDYEEAIKQLHKYSQDTRAPYGILLTDISCAIYRNKYFSYNQKPKRELEDKLPLIEKIEDRMAFYALLDFLLYKKSLKYVLLSIIFLFIFTTFFSFISKFLGLGISIILEFLTGMFSVLIFFIIVKVRKIFD